MRTSNNSNDPGTRKKHHPFLNTSGGYTTRHLAALDFLQKISMVNESSIRENGMRNINRQQHHQEGDEGDVFGQQKNYDQSMDDGSGYTSRKLQGPTATSVGIPFKNRYRMLEVTQDSAVIKNWEKTVLDGKSDLKYPNSRPLLSSRLFVARQCSYPIMTFSIIKYDAGVEAKKLSKLKAEDQKGLEIYILPQRDWRGFSYKPLFEPLYEERKDDYLFEQHGYLYDPNILDDPDMLHGAHRYVLGRAAQTGPILSSMILYVNDKDLKNELNQMFRDKHPQLPPSLTLSKIRNIKKSALLGCMELDMEISTVAFAVIYFERLCLKGLVTKFNRKLTMAVALLMAYKFNEKVLFSEDAGNQHYNKRLVELLKFFDREWEVSRQEIFQAEFGAFMHLGFCLHVPREQVYVVYTRLLKLVNKTSRSYLGEEMEALYAQTVRVLQRAKELTQHQQRDQDQDQEQDEHTNELFSNSVLQKQRSDDRSYEGRSEANAENFAGFERRSATSSLVEGTHPSPHSIDGDTEDSGMVKQADGSAGAKKHKSIFLEDEDVINSVFFSSRP